jgi:hypothetical protein
MKVTFGAGNVFAKPFMKLIDWTKVPRGTMTNYGEFIAISNKGKGQMVDRFNANYDWRLENVEFFFLRIVPQTRWTYHDGGECPVPEGLKWIL